MSFLWLPPTPGRSLLNVFHLGVGFLILFSADLAIGNMQKTINTSISEEKPSYTVDGYLTLCLIYVVLGVMLWLAPSFVSLLGYKICFVIGGACLTFYIFSLSFEEVWITYLAIIIVGAGGSFLWAAEGHYLVINSNAKTMPRNVGVFWSLFSASMIFGNIYAAIELEGKTRIDRETRHRLIYSTGSVALASTVLLALLRRPETGGSDSQAVEKPLQALAKTWRIFTTRDMCVLSATFIYGGFQQSFGTGVYSPCLGFTQHFGTRAKQLVAISGLLYGVGDSFGGLVYMIIDKYQLRYSRRHIIIGGMIIQTVAYIGAYLNLPNSSVFGETLEKPYIEPRIWLALLCSFLIGVGDSCLNTQIFPLLRDLHPEHSAHTSSLYKFTKGMAVAVSFFFSSYLGLHLQLILIFLFGIVGAVAFSYVDIRNSKQIKTDLVIK